MKELFVYTDGGARGNPGPAAIGVYIIDSNCKEIAKFGKRIGETTNNTAEYSAVIEALSWIKENIKEKTKVNFFLDSSLVVNQLNGIFKVKENHLRNLLFHIRQLEQEISFVFLYKHLPREKNKMADSLVNSCF